MFTRVVVAMMITRMVVAMMMKAQSSHGRVNNCSKWPPSSSYPTGAASCFHDDRDDYDDHGQDLLHLSLYFCRLPNNFHGDALGCSNVAEATSGRPFLNQLFEAAVCAEHYCGFHIQSGLWQNHPTIKLRFFFQDMRLLQILDWTTRNSNFAIVAY